MFHGKLDTEERFIMANFKEVKVVDNFYQNSLFFPMPTVAISTLDEEGRTTIPDFRRWVVESFAFS